MDDTRHIAEELLIDSADDPASVPNRAQVEEHLDACAACWTKLDDYRLLAEAMRHEETWWAAREIADGAWSAPVAGAMASRLRSTVS